ncbi:hypothetical protein GCM10010869_62610 [Mesorhizobium tianshanense]|uniref:DUF1871 family protein n=1 Tax=Mesorhizobium tianshanense TaxID=39844 RepID=A0A562M9X6_9HYPH|nr:hypothetical protein IQ26_07656 [Mesorhizobium tianshanense]GLS40664.1 hypothetical protein GCM10010869_62610 [Mesorhizobium tianshanense]
MTIEMNERHSRIREILLHEWDPIGVREIPRAADEYDAYADEVYMMSTDRGARASDIARYLFNIATEHMGLSDLVRLKTKCDQVAKLIAGLKPGF